LKIVIFAHCILIVDS